METIPNFTPRVQQALTIAKELAHASFSPEVSLTHLFLGIAGLQTEFISDFFARNDLDLFEFTESLSSDLGKTAAEQAVLITKEEELKTTEPPFNSSVKSVLAIGSLAAEKLKHEYVGIEHLMLGFLKNKQSPLLPFLSSCKRNPNDLIYDLKLLFRDDNTPFSPERPRSNSHSYRSKKFNTEGVLEAHTVNFNQLAKDGKIDTIVGKESELQELAEILCRRKKNNPILLGSAGVGKTALVEGLAQQIVNGSAPDFLLPKVIYGLDLASLIAGTKYRGQFEDRLQKLIAQIKEDEHAVIFIDELHTLVGAGSAEGTLDAANILKPTLARGDITCIGATTFKEYKKNIEKDSALARRFQPVILSEPSREESLEILQGIKGKYEEFHGVKYKPEILSFIVDTALRYMPTRHMPDKAIDILDQSASHRKIKAFKRPERAKEIEQILNSIESPKISKEEEALFDEYKILLDDWAAKTAKRSPTVSFKDVVDVVASITHVSKDLIRQKGSARAKGLDKNLKKFIIGQDEALSTIKNALLRAQTGLADPEKPMGGFLFLGASGVGKTYTAKILADIMFGGKDNLIQINMSEYSDKISSSRLIGAAPGYVGYDESGQLTEQVRRQPYSVILFDEIEKAHEEVTNLLLQILEEGKLTDNFGRDVDFSNSLIICTGNIGSHLFNKNTSMGFSGETEEQKTEGILEEAKKTLRPELINRFTEVAVFKQLSPPALKNIIKLELNKLKSRLQKAHGIRLTVRKKLLDHLIALGMKNNDGARRIKGIIKKEIENPLAVFLNSNNPVALENITLDRPKGETTIFS